MQRHEAKSELISRLEGVNGMDVTSQDPAPPEFEHESIFEILTVPHDGAFFLWIRPRELEYDEYGEDREWTRVDVVIEERALERAAERDLLSDLATILVEHADVPTEIEQQTDLCARLWGSSFDVGNEVRTFVSIPWQNQTLRAYFEASSDEIDMEAGVPWAELVVAALSR